jgi:ribosomal-protein-alanine N-acetyltransferase
VREASDEADLVRGTTLPDPFTPHDGRSFIKRQWSRAESGDGLSLVIEDSTSKAAIGCLTLMLRRSAVADLGYWLLPGARGRGSAREAVELLVYSRRK